MSEASLTERAWAAGFFDAEGCTIFHVERSLGYGKRSDCTSLSQMVEGVWSQKLNGWVRKGCGLGKAAVTRANKALARADRQFDAMGERYGPVSP